MVASLVQGGSGTVAVTGYLKSNDKRKELELVSLLPEDIRKLRVEMKRAGQMGVSPSRSLAMREDGGVVQFGYCLTVPDGFLEGKLVSL